MNEEWEKKRTEDRSGCWDEDGRMEDKIRMRRKIEQKRNIGRGEEE